jgi:hypothetical protein
MPLGTPELGRLQRWMQAVIVDPAGVEAGCASDEARREIEIEPGDLERIVTRSRALSAADRLAVYAGAYHARLLECLREEYPALVYTLGEELFDEFAVGYLERHPSTSYTLHHLGAEFPRYLAESCPTEEDRQWAAFLVDLATLERLYGDVFDGPGNEGRELLSPERLATLSLDEWAMSRLIPSPDLRLVELRYPMHDYIRAIRRNENPTPPDPAETLLAVHRRDYTVRRHAVTRPQFALLQAITAGKNVLESIDRAAEYFEAGADEFAPALREWFRGWAVEGFFLAVESGG